MCIGVAAAALLPLHPSSQEDDSCLRFAEAHCKESEVVLCGGGKASETATALTKTMIS